MLDHAQAAYRMQQTRPATCSLVTARQWRYFVGSTKVLVPPGVRAVVDDDTFTLAGYWGRWDASRITSLVSRGWLTRT
jgi:hypothetical protein